MYEVVFELPPEINLFPLHGPFQSSPSLTLLLNSSHVPLGAILQSSTSRISINPCYCPSLKTLFLTSGHYHNWQLFL